MKSLSIILFTSNKYDSQTSNSQAGPRNGHCLIPSSLPSSSLTSLRLTNGSFSFRSGLNLDRRDVQTKTQQEGEMKFASSTTLC